jgi:hypothetical protein
MTSGLSRPARLWFQQGLAWGAPRVFMRWAPRAESDYRGSVDESESLLLFSADGVHPTTEMQLTCGNLEHRAQWIGQPRVSHGHGGSAIAPPPPVENFARSVR